MSNIFEHLFCGKDVHSDCTTEVDSDISGVQPPQKPCRHFNEALLRWYYDAEHLQYLSVYAEYGKNWYDYGYAAAPQVLATKPYRNKPIVGTARGLLLTLYRHSRLLNEYSSDALSTLHTAIDDHKIKKIYAEQFSLKYRKAFSLYTRLLADIATVARVLSTNIYDQNLQDERILRNEHLFSPDLYTELNEKLQQCEASARDMLFGFQDVEQQLPVKDAEDLERYVNASEYQAVVNISIYNLLINSSLNMAYLFMGINYFNTHTDQKLMTVPYSAEDMIEAASMISIQELNSHMWEIPPVLIISTTVEPKQYPYYSVGGGTDGSVPRSTGVQMPMQVSAPVETETIPTSVEADETAPTEEQK